MSTLSSAIPWKELAGMLSILMLSAISLHRPDTSEGKLFMFMKRKSGGLKRGDPVGGCWGSVGGRVTPVDRLRAKTTGISASTVNAPWKCANNILTG